MKNSFKLIFILILSINSALATEELVLNSETNYNPTHANRFSFLLGVNPSTTKAQDITNYTFSYGKKLEDYWLDSNFLITNGVFNKMTTNNPPATGLTDAQLIDTKSTLTTFGLGIGRESSYIQTLLPFKDLHELMAADITYNIYKESTSSKSFTGPGMIAKFSLYNRFSNYFSAGAQFTYSLATVKRSADVDTETSSDRSLTMSYLTVGFDLSFYL